MVFLFSIFLPARVFNIVGSFGLPGVLSSHDTGPVVLTTDSQGVVVLSTQAVLVAGP